MVWECTIGNQIGPKREVTVSYTMVNQIDKTQNPKPNIFSLKPIQSSIPWYFLLGASIFLYVHFYSNTLWPSPTRFQVAIVSWDQLDATVSKRDTVTHLVNVIRDVALEGAQLVLFPEYILNPIRNHTNHCTHRAISETEAEYIPLIPNASQDFPRITPCSNRSWNDRPMSQMLSCTAQRYRIYVVINMHIRIPCSQDVVGNLCPSGNWMLLNAMVTFDEHGRLVGRYFKRHLASESPALTQPTPSILKAYPDNPILSTSFGVRFGMLVCYDLVHPYPMNEYLRLGIEYVLWSNSWHTTPVLGTQLGLAQGIARMLNVTIIAASTANAFTNGIGVFSSNKTVIMHTNPHDCENPQNVDRDCFGYLIAKLPYASANDLQKINNDIAVDDDVASFDLTLKKQRCGIFPRHKLVQSDKRFGDQEIYEKYLQRYAPDDFCAVVELQPHKTARVELTTTDGTTCMVTAKTHSTFARFILRNGNVHNTPQTPCEIQARACSFMLESAFHDFNVTGESVDFTFLNITQILPRDTDFGKSVPFIVGNQGVTEVIHDVFHSNHDAVQIVSVVHHGPVLFGGVIGMLLTEAGQNWPGCNECFSTLLGYPEGRERSQFPPNTDDELEKMGYHLNCAECDEKENHNQQID